MTIETVNKFRVITGLKTPLTRYHRAIQILQCYVANKLVRLIALQYAAANVNKTKDTTRPQG